MTIQPQTIEVDRKEARDMYRRYKEHVHYAKPIDREIQRTYQLIAQGRVVIRALESIKVAGVNEQSLPKLAIARADSKEVFFSSSRDGSGSMSPIQWTDRRHSNMRISFPAGTFAVTKETWKARAMLPIVPVHLRPKRGLANYHVLWEAEWSPIPPVDPLLLRRVGKGDLWLVVAAWDLTPVEQAALATRMHG